MDNILENNKLIANFIGWEVSNKAKTLKKRDLTINTIPHGYFKINPEDIQFHSSWDWLMPVFEKIRNHDKDCVVEDVNYNVGCDFRIEVYIDNLFTFIELRESHKSDISMCYKAVVEFIKWYKRVNND